MNLPHLRTVVLVLGVATGASAAPSGPALTLVREGRPVIPIRVGGSSPPAVRLEAEALRDTIRRISGATLSFSEEPGAAIEIGVCPALEDRLGEDGSLLDEAEGLANSDRVRRRIDLSRTALEHTLAATALWRELEEEYQRLAAGGEGHLSSEETAGKLSERIRPFQESLVRLYENTGSLNWMEGKKSNYVRALLSPAFGKTYLGLLPAEQE